MLISHVMLRTWKDKWEQQLAEKAEAYLRESFGASVWLVRAEPTGMPFFITDQYALWRAEIFERSCVLMAVRAATGATADELARHVHVVRERSNTPTVVLVFETLSPSRRLSLLKQRLAFLVPGAQLYIPEALMDLRERAPRAPVHDVETFSPTSQMIVIGALLRRETEAPSATALATRYGVATMSVSRAFDELQAAGLADTSRTGKQRVLRFVSHGLDLWEVAAPRLQSPVRKVRTVGIPFPQHFPGRVAGESALSLYTPLASPRVQRLAVAAANWPQLVRDHGLIAREPGDPAGDEVETWSYDPAALADRTDRNVVDRLSLYLSTRDHPDERVAQAAEQLLEDMSWS
ncbi:hypothetical protein [Caulobacter sp. RHG1]|uniref:hypothetical protein n=1 Tax=Caulobacter sp. (strain RHG1) TaxID=2545762 RepID=UPI00155347AF|nr:hypothetical protein [Caulobacter sp. RHG1]NQE64487.1 hypothetical protein [Caulobacter sp. RHG1]